MLEDSRNVLLQLKDPSTPLLKKMRQKAPGTYFHSLIVSELAAGACLIFPNANPLLAQVGALYHDIGKIVNPEAFAENQEDGNYPFQPEIIITHVEKSLEIAQSFNLPEEIRRFMGSHHGTQRAPNSDPDKNNIYPKSFLPESIEETLVMFADSIEAAIRSHGRFDAKGMKKIIDGVIQYKIDQNQLKDSVLLSYDLKPVKNDFFQTLNAIYHRRHATEVKSLYY